MRTFELREDNGVIALVTEDTCGSEHDLLEALADAPNCVRARLVLEYHSIRAEIEDAVRSDEPGLCVTERMRA